MSAEQIVIARRQLDEATTAYTVATAKVATLEQRITDAQQRSGKSRKNDWKARRHQRQPCD